VRITAQTRRIVTRMASASRIHSLNAQRWALLGLRSLTRRLHRGPKLPPHLQVGLRGEFEALFYLRRLGFTIVERRWRSPEHNGDLDLIAWEGESLVIVEVKTRSARDLTPAALAVDDGKRRMLRRMANSYVRTLPHQYRDGLLLRFDILSVYLGESVAPEFELLRNIEVRT
jgi:putative endonuclease